MGVPEISEHEYVETAVSHVRQLLKPAFHSLLDWPDIRQKLAEHAKNAPAARPLPNEAAARVFAAHAVPRLFFAGAPVKPVAQPGVQSRVTPEIEEFVLGTLGLLKNRTFLDTVRQGVASGDARFSKKTVKYVKRLVEEVRGFRRVRIDQKLAEELYAKQTAHHIIATRNIPTTFQYGFGCAQMCVALGAALKAIGLPYHFVRTFHDYDRMIRRSRKKPRLLKSSPHSVILFEAGGTRYIADPWQTGRLAKVTPKMQANIDRMGEAGQWVHTADKEGKIEAEDLWGLGITSYEKYIERIKYPAYLEERVKKGQLPSHGVPKHWSDEKG